MHIKAHIRQPDSDGRSHRSFTHAAFTYQHNQTVFTASNIIDQVRK